MKKPKLVPNGANPQRSEAAHPRSETVHVPFDLSVRFRTALVLTPILDSGGIDQNAAPRPEMIRINDDRGCVREGQVGGILPWTSLSTNPA